MSTYTPCAETPTGLTLHARTHTCPSGTHVSERSLLCRSIGHITPCTVRSPFEATHTDHILSAHQDVLHNHESSPRRFYIPVGSNLLRTARLSEPSRARQCLRTLSQIPSVVLLVSMVLILVGVVVDQNLLQEIERALVSFWTSFCALAVDVTPV